MVGVVQSVRAPDCGSGGRGFESHHSPALCFIFFELLAQVVEHLTFNQVVPGSSPGWLIEKRDKLWFVSFFLTKSRYNYR